MPLGSTSNFAVILPVEKANETLNPSWELGTTGATAIQSATLGSTSGFQQFGAWSLSVTPNSNGTSGAYMGTWTASNGSAYTVSAYVRGANGVAMMIGVGDSAGLNLLGSTAFTGGGTWQRYSYAFTEATGAVRSVVIRKTTGADVNPYYVDGVQVEKGSLTTFFDGQTGGGTWQGGAHQSQSFRPGQYRGGGSVVALQDLGMLVGDALGIGMPPLENTSQSYAILDGAQFQRTRAAAKPFTLPVTLLGNSLQGIHAVRRAVINAFKIDEVTPQQPTRFWYTGAGGTLQIDAVLDAGLEMGQLEGFTEKPGVRFVAYDPYWYSTTQQGTTLAARQNIGSVKFAAYRDPLGRWGTMGPSGSALDNVVNAIAPASNGVVYYGGNFGSAAGTRTRFVAQWTPSTGQWGSLAGGTLTASAVYTLAETAAGSLLIGGNISAANGTTANGIALYSPAGSWGTTNGGGVSAGSIVYGIDFASDGFFYVGGTFAAAGGTAGANSAARYNATTDRWGTLRTGITNGRVFALAAGLDANVYFGGTFATADGTTTSNIAAWNTFTAAWGTLGLGIQKGGYTGVPFVNVITVAPNGLVYAGGVFGSAGGGTAQSFAVWNGVQWTGFGSGILDSTGGMGLVYAALALKDSSVILSGNIARINTLNVPSQFARLVSTTFTAFDLDLSVTGGVSMTALSQANDGTIYAGMDTGAGSAYAASVAQVVNSGIAQTYPVVQIWNNSTGTAPIYQLLNTLTNDSIFFNLNLQPQEKVTLTLTPGARSFTSSFRGNVFGAIVPGSNLATWRLLSGTNYISFLAGNESVQTVIYWSPRHHSADGTFIP